MNKITFHYQHDIDLTYSSTGLILFNLKDVCCILDHKIDLVCTEIKDEIVLCDGIKYVNEFGVFKLIDNCKYTHKIFKDWFLNEVLVNARNAMEMSFEIEDSDVDTEEDDGDYITVENIARCTNFSIDTINYLLQIFGFQGKYEQTRKINCMYYITANGTRLWHRKIVDVIKHYMTRPIHLSIRSG